MKQKMALGYSAYDCLFKLQDKTATTQLKQPSFLLAVYTIGVVYSCFFESCDVTPANKSTCWHKKA